MPKHKYLKLGKYVRYEKKLPPSSIDELMDLRETWTSPATEEQRESEEVVEKLRDEVKKMKHDFEAQLDTQKKINEELRKEVTAKTKVRGQKCLHFF